MRPVRVGGSAAALAALSLALLGVARSTGSGWLLVLLAVVGGVAVVGIVAPALSLLRLHVVVDSPADAVARRPVDVDVTVRRAGLGGIRLRPVEPAGSAVRVDGPATGAVSVTHERRGVVHAMRLEASTAAPFGLVTWRRRFDAPVLVYVAPVPSEARRPQWADPGALGSEAGGVRSAEEAAVRTVCDYQVGDPMRLVHWPATARSGHLMVKQLEAPAAPALAMVVDLRGDAEATASRAAALGRDALASGIAVTVLTVEAEGVAVGPVDSTVDLGRRLARAVVGVPPEGPVPDGAQVVRP